jgi:hypothetical protein
MPIAISANFLRFELVINLKKAKDIGHEGRSSGWPLPCAHPHARAREKSLKNSARKTYP